jgi:hypothetical protein
VADSVDQSVKCGDCGAELGEPANTPVQARVPCPSCGSTKRTAVLHRRASLQVSSHLSALHERQGEAMGFSETARQGRTSNASLRNDGAIDMSLLGSSPQGEEDTEAACQVLRERLNLDGARWGSITDGNEPADRVFIDMDDGSRTLQVQVVRAIVSQDLWRDLNSRGAAQRLLSPATAITELQKAIEAKANDRRIPKSIRPQLVLALDAIRLPGLAFDAIVRQFRSTHMAWAASHGFVAVWLVGPTSRLVWRLDS